MVKRIVGNIFAIAVVVIVVFTALGAGSYESMLSADLFPSKAEPQVEEQTTAPNTTEQDAAAEEAQVVESENEATDVSATTEADDEEESHS